MSQTPDLAGFVTAQQSLRALMGTPCVFHVPQASTWPPGTRINADTGEPYSAMAVRSNPEFVDVTATVLIIIKQGSPMRPQADTKFAEGGLMSGMDIILDVDARDFATVGQAAEFTINTLRYNVVEWKPFGVGGSLYRWLCYGGEN